MATSQGYYPKVQLLKCAISQRQLPKSFLATAFGPQPFLAAVLGPWGNALGKVPNT